MSKDFVNLPNNYKKFLENVKIAFDDNLIKKLHSNNITYNEIIKLHNDVNKIAEDYDCTTYEINRILNYYKKENVIIDILKKISSIRNKYIVYHSKKSKYWNINLKNIQNKIKHYSDKNVEIDQIELAFIKVIKKYKYDWDGLWSVIELGKNGNIKNIDLFDLDDMNSIFEMI
jgi:hypothetical protein